MYSHFSKSAVQEFVQLLSERTCPPPLPGKVRPFPVCGKNYVSESWKKSTIHIGIPHCLVRE